MSNDFRQVNEIISNLFEGIDTNKLDGAMKIIQGWKSVVSTISSGKDGKKNSLGEVLSAHSKVIDLKNNVLLIETDHPGYIQTMQMYNRYILRGLNNKFPELNINSISYRLKGTDYQLMNKKHDEKPKEQPRKVIDEKDLDKLKINEDLPEKLKERMEQLRQCLLTKND